MIILAGDMVLAVIPARYASTRLPGKALADIGGKPMIQWVWERTSRAKSVSRVLVATDDERIKEAVHRFGGEAVMTSPELPSGTDRIARAVESETADIIVNVQGDEPLIKPEAIDAVTGILLKQSDTVMGTLIHPIASGTDLANPNVVKTVIDSSGRALYFTRSTVPFCRDVDPSHWLNHGVYYRHIGIYSYRYDFLSVLTSLPPSKLERLEKLEQLRAMEAGYAIHTAQTGFEPLGVDTPEDLERVRKIIENMKKK